MARPRIDANSRWVPASRKIHLDPRDLLLCCCRSGHCENQGQDIQVTTVMRPSALQPPLVFNGRSCCCLHEQIALVSAGHCFVTKVISPVRIPCNYSTADDSFPCFAKMRNKARRSGLWHRPNLERVDVEHQPFGLTRAGVDTRAAGLLQLRCSRLVVSEMAGSASQKGASGSIPFARKNSFSG
jgi:hypothetical protein